MTDLVYLDHAATTPVDPRVVEAMLPFFTDQFGNPSSPYGLGRRGWRALDAAREVVAEELGCQPSEVVFTSGGSESDNLAVKGVALALRERGNHLVTSQIEHHAVLRACQFLERRLGFQVTYLPVDQYGRVDPRAVEEALTDRTVLVSVMLGNNEVGTLQPIQAIAEIAHARGVLVHTDAVQGVGLLPVRVDDLGVDLLSLSAHKFYGPKGVGALYVRKGVALAPQIHGGGQERNRRAGTENVPLVVGMAAALRLARSERESRVRHVLRLRDRLLQEVPRRVPGALVTGHPVDRLPHIASFVFPGVESEGVLMALDLEGICASSGSACTSGSLEPSHVLRAMGLPREATTGSLRLSVGKDTTDAHVDRLLQVLPGIVERARAVPVGESVSR
ncbi:MAG TPA: cysteine desulfurase family protein [Chloroflexota bacterium]